MAAGTVRVVSKRKGGVVPVAGEVVVEIDRSNPVLGNRHVLHDHRDPAARWRVIEAFRRDLEEDSQRSGPIASAIDNLAERVRRGERLALRCWCAPEPCHGDIIAAAVCHRVGIPRVRTDDREVDGTEREQCHQQHQGSLFG